MFATDLRFVRIKRKFSKYEGNERYRERKLRLGLDVGKMFLKTRTRSVAAMFICATRRQWSERKQETFKFFAKAKWLVNLSINDHAMRLKFVT